MFFGFNTKVMYKNWDFSINGHGSVGNDVINTARKNGASTYSNDISYGYLSNINKELMIPGWTLPASTEQGYSDYWIEDASFLKVDDINLGYTFKPKRFVRDIRVAASVQNVLTVTKFKGLDPEVTSLDGVDGSSFPRPTTYTLRLNINF
jgi:iron complex outermembrane receptor protein